MLTIGIAGGTCSGKTTLTDNLWKRFDPHVTVIRHDDYYKAYYDLTYDQRAALNYDEPDAFDNKLFAEHIKALKEGHSINCPVYDYTQYNRSNKVREITPNDIIIVEGILIFTEPEICDLLDIKIFVDTDADVRLVRRIVRDVKERGRTLDSVITQYMDTVKPMHEKYVQPSRASADVVVLDGGENKVALDMIIGSVEYYLSTNK